MLSRKNFKNLLAVMAVLVLSEQFSDKLLFKFFDLNSDCFARYDAFC